MIRPHMSSKHIESDLRIEELKQQRQIMLDAEARFCIEKEVDVYRLDSAQKFLPSIFAKEAEAEAEAWAKSHDIWLPGISQDTNTMGAYLNSNAISAERLADINKFYLVLFYVDDMFGNDRQADITPEELRSFKQQIENIGKWLAYDIPFTPTGDLEVATVNIFEKIKQNSDPEWFAHFKQVCIEHLVLAIENQNTSHTQEIHTIESFNETRVKIAGMYTSLMLDMYATNKYVSSEEIKKYGYTELIDALYFDCSVICSYFNELFSFEREVIDDNTDYNLIAILMLNDDELTLYDAVTAAINLTNHHIDTFIQTKEEVFGKIEAQAGKIESRINIAKRTQTELSNEEEEKLKAQYGFLVSLIQHLVGIEAFINAALFWQVITERYQREDTIFYENLPEYRALLAEKFETRWSKLRRGLSPKLKPGLDLEPETDENSDEDSFESDQELLN